MKNNETGEFELVLGNRQLLSGFFIVVLLFGVAFAMGYIVGRNSSPSPKQQAETTGETPAAKEPRREAPAAPPAAAPEETPAETKATETSPARRETPAETPSPAAPSASRETAATSAPDTPAADAPPGSYWQVIATSNRTAAAALQQSLKDKGFPVTLGPGPNNLVRVLVGPYSDTQSMGRAKTQLEASGLHPVRK